MERISPVDWEEGYLGSLPSMLLCPVKIWGPKPFRFLNYWLEHEGFIEEVKSAWNENQISGRAAYVVKKKLKRLKERLQKWNKEVYGIVDLKIDKLITEINQLETDCGGNDPDRLERIKSINEEFWKQLRAKESILCQKSRSKWQREGDSNSRFFHACVNSNRRRNQITALKVGEEWLEEASDVKRAIKCHFESCYILKLMNHVLCLMEFHLTENRKMKMTS